MNTEIATALISLAGSILAALLSYAAAETGARRAGAESAQLIAYRLEQLEKRVQAHSSLAERLARVEARLAAQGGGA